MLRRLRFVFVRAAYIRHETNVNICAVLSTYVQSELPYCLQKVPRFYIAYSAADFCDNYVGPGSNGGFFYKTFCFVGNVRYYLYGFAEIFALSFLFYNRIEYFTGRKVGIFIELSTGKSFVMS